MPVSLSTLVLLLFSVLAQCACAKPHFATRRIAPGVSFDSASPGRAGSKPQFPTHGAEASGMAGSKPQFPTLGAETSAQFPTLGAESTASASSGRKPQFLTHGAESTAPHGAETSGMAGRKPQFPTLGAESTSPASSGRKPQFLTHGDGGVSLFSSSSSVNLVGCLAQKVVDLMVHSMGSKCSLEPVHAHDICCGNFAWGFVTGGSFVDSPAKTHHNQFGCLYTKPRDEYFLQFDKCDQPCPGLAYTYAAGTDGLCGGGCKDCPNFPSFRQDCAGDPDVECGTRWSVYACSKYQDPIKDTTTPSPVETTTTTTTTTTPPTTTPPTTTTLAVPATPATTVAVPATPATTVAVPATPATTVAVPATPASTVAEPLTSTTTVDVLPSIFTVPEPPTAPSKAHHTTMATSAAVLAAMAFMF